MFHQTMFFYSKLCIKKWSLINYDEPHLPHLLTTTTTPLVNMNSFMRTAPQNYVRQSRPFQNNPIAHNFWMGPWINGLLLPVIYRKIPKISPGAYIFKKAFLQGLMFVRAYIQRGLSTEGNLRLKIDWASFMVGSKFTVSALFYFVFDFSAVHWWRHEFLSLKSRLATNVRRL